MTNIIEDTEIGQIGQDKSDLMDALQSRAKLASNGEDSSRSLSISPGMPQSVLRIPVSLQVVIGTTRLPLSQIAQLTAGSTIALEQKLGAPATILVNGREVAKGEIFVLEDEGADDRLGITITEVFQPSPQEGV